MTHLCRMRELICATDRVRVWVFQATTRPSDQVFRATPGTPVYGDRNVLCDRIDWLLFSLITGLRRLICLEGKTHGFLCDRDAGYGCLGQPFGVSADLSRERVHL